MRDDPRALLIDFGGVLTSSVTDAIRSWSTDVSGDPHFVLDLLRTDHEAARLLADHECGRIDEAAFEAGMASRMRLCGVDPATGLAAGIQARILPDPVMLNAVAGVRAAGVPVAVVSNSLGDDCYRGYDLAGLADVVVISAEVGVRKPSRRIYALACERLGVAPTDALMVDDLQQNLAGAARLGVRGFLHSSTTPTDRLLREWFGTTLEATTATSDGGACQ